MGILCFLPLVRRTPGFGPRLQRAWSQIWSQFSEGSTLLIQIGPVEDFIKRFASEYKRFSRKAATFGVGEADAPFAQPLFDQSIIFLDVVDQIQLMAVEPSSEHHQHRMKRRKKRCHQRRVYRRVRDNHRSKDVVCIVGHCALATSAHCSWARTARSSPEAISQTPNSTRCQRTTANGISASHSPAAGGNAGCAAVHCCPELFQEPG